MALWCEVKTRIVCALNFIKRLAEKAEGGSDDIDKEASIRLLKIMDEK